jgi:hypothetical protein
LKNCALKRVAGGTPAVPVKALTLTKVRPFGSILARLLLRSPFRIILSLLEARSYRPVGSRPLFLLGE